MWNLNCWLVFLFRITSSYDNHISLVPHLIRTGDRTSFLQKEHSICMNPPRNKFLLKKTLMQSLIFFGKCLEVQLKTESAYYFLEWLKESWRIRWWRVTAQSHSVYLKILWSKLFIFWSLQTSEEVALSPSASVYCEDSKVGEMTFDLEDAHF